MRAVMSYDWADERARKLAGSSLPLDRRIELAQALRDAFADGVERSAVCIEVHSCVSSCCEAQPSAAVARQLAECVRGLARGR